MKAFVYDRKDSHKIAIITDVVSVWYSPYDGITIFTADGATHKYNRHKVKTRIYQN